MNRRTFLRSSAASAALLNGGAAWGRLGQPQLPKLRDEDILERSPANIERYRKGDGTIIVTDSAGKPVPGAKIKIEQLRHEFLFGSHFFLFERCGELEQKYRDHVAGLLNYCTLGFYWDAYEHGRGNPDYAYTDRVTAWTREHGLTCKGHPLAWDHPCASPAWLPDNNAEIQRLSTGRVTEIVSRFAGRINYWDVVNEATHLDKKTNHSRMAEWASSLGPVKYVAMHLQAARRANPHATLLVNDYRTDIAYYRILSQLLAMRMPEESHGQLSSPKLNGASNTHGRKLFDVIGIQSHMHDSVWPVSKVWNVCERYADLGLPIHFTETTIVSGKRIKGDTWEPTAAKGEEAQAEATARFYTTLFSHPSLRAISWWDFTDYGAWQNAPAGWLRADMSPKPVFDRMKSLIKGQWWTNLEGTAGGRGEFKTRAFYGEHRITVELPNGERRTKDVTWQRQGNNHFTV